MFKFIIHCLGPLKFFPLLAWVADALMMTWYCLFNRRIAEAIDDLVLEVSHWEGVSLSIHRYGGRQFNYHNRELAHIHSNGVLDVLLNRKTKQQLLAQGRAEEHHTFKTSGWVSFYLERPEDYERAISLLGLAMESKHRHTP